jgi:polysaccharide pyruvyl transferase WcaK-like protein
MTRPINIGLLWHSASSGNLGVAALTVTNMALAGKVAAEMGLDPRFVIIGMRDGVSRYVPPEAADVFVVDTRSLVSPGGCWRVIGAQDCILDIGAGDSFAEIYGAKRFFTLWATKMMAILRRVPLCLSPQTIGPFTRSPYKEMAAMAMAGADAVIARDRMSLDLITHLAPRAHSQLSVDVAFALPFDNRGAERGGPKVRVGVNVSGLLFNEAVAGTNKFGLEIDYALFTRKLVQRLLDRGAEVHLIAHATSAEAYDDDSRVADRLAAEFPDAVRVPDFATPSAVKSYISSLDFIVAGRMHACIAAFSSGTPVVPIAYSRKFAGLFGLLEYSWLVPVTGMSTVAALDYLEDALDRRAELSHDEAQGMQKVDGLLEVYRAELRRIFTAAVPAG